jgi:aminoglycoside phosphotransferase (APT) family kinase protein
MGARGGIAACPDAGAVELARLAEWMTGRGLGAGPITGITRLAGGTQNILLRFSRDGRDFVLRRPPAIPRVGNNETMRREARVLAALAGTAVPHPRLIAACGEDDVLGAAFYLMEPVDGFNAVNGLPALHASSPDIRRRMGLALVDGAAALGALDHVAVGLADFGRSDGFLQRQVGRWRAQLESYRSCPEWPGAAGLPGLADIEAYLEAGIPQHGAPGIMHGDYSIGNVMYRPDGPELAAIVDWELATIGDPLIDLGWIIACWPGAGGPDLPVLTVQPFDGFPAIGALVEHYASRSARDLSDLDWYAVLSCYKLAILLEGSFVRACAGAAPIQTGLMLHDTAVKLMQRALWRATHSITPPGATAMSVAS